MSDNNLDIESLNDLRKSMEAAKKNRNASQTSPETKDAVDAESLDVFRQSMEVAKKNRDAMESLKDVEDVVAADMPVATRGLKAKGANVPESAPASNDASALNASKVVPVTPKKAEPPKDTSAAAQATPTVVPMASRTPKTSEPEVSSAPAVDNEIPKVAKTPKLVGGSLTDNTPETPAKSAADNAIPKVARKPKTVGTSVVAGVNQEPAAPAAKKPAPEAADSKHSSDTAGALVSQLAAHIRLWQANLPEDKEAGILAILGNGTEIPIQYIATEGKHGLIIHGTLNEKSCMIAAHQSNLTLLCTSEDKRPGVSRPELRFFVDGKKLV